MISAKQLLPLLVGTALGAGGWLYGLRGSPGMASSESFEQQLKIAQDEVALLSNENASLRSLAQGGGEVSVPQEMISAVEKDYGLKFISNPVIHQVASEELGYRIEAALEIRFGPQGLDDRQEVYQLLGWLGAEDDLLKDLVAVREVGALSWFDELAGEAWVTDRFDFKNVPDQAALLRVLVRILLNQHFPAAVAYPGDDAAWAREALHAGAASGAESRFYAGSARSIGFMPLNGNAAAERVMRSLPDFIKGITLFPSVSGKPLADTLYVKGTEEFTKALGNPPQNTFAVIMPAEKSRGGKIDFPEMDDEIFLSESAGYLGLRLWLETLGDLGLVEDIARGWMRDGYLLFADGETGSALVWEVEFQSENLASSFETIVRKRTDEMKASSPDRFFGVGRISPTRVRFMNSATAETLSEFLQS